MSGLRLSRGLTNLVADTLRLRGTTAPGLVITDATGEVSVSTAPDLTGLTVTGSVQLGNTNVIGSLTANSLISLTSVRAPTAILHSIDASSAIVDTLRSKSIVLQGALGPGTLTFSDTEGLLLNSLPVISSGSGSQGPTGPAGTDGVNGTNGLNGNPGATGPLGPTGPAGEFTPTPVPFDPLSDASSLQDVIQSVNLFLETINGLLVTVQIPEITNFRTTTIRDTSAILAWDLSGSGYLFTITGAGLHTDISGRTFTLTGLTAATPYTVTITGRNNRVFAPGSKQLTFTTSAPPVISNFLVTEDLLSAYITWSSDPAADTYKIYFDVWPPSFEGGVDYRSTVPNITFTGLAPNSDYFVTVTGTLGNVTGYTSDQFTFATLPIPTVTGFTVNTITSSSVNLSWDSVGNEYVYTLTNDGTDYTTAPGVLSYDIDGLLPNTAYTITIVAVLGIYPGNTPAYAPFTTAAAPFISGSIQQTEYVLGQTPDAQVTAGNYFDPAYYGNGSGPYLRNMQTSLNTITDVPFSDVVANYRIYRSVFYLKPPIDISGMLLWISCDDGCAIRYTDPDNPNVWINLVNSRQGWIGGVRPQGDGSYRFPGDNVGESLVGNGILLNLSSQKYYKFEVISNNKTGYMTCSLNYTVPQRQTPGTPVTYTTQNGNDMGIMSDATPETTIPAGLLGSQRQDLEGQTARVDYTWYYCDPVVHDVFDIIDSTEISQIAPNVFSRTTKTLDSWPAQLTKVSQISSITLTISYRVDVNRDNDNPITNLGIILNVENTINTIPIFTKDEYNQTGISIAEGGIVNQTYLYTNFNQWFPTIDGDTIDKTKTLSFDWNFISGGSPRTVSWEYPATPDTCIINYRYDLE